MDTNKDQLFISRLNQHPKLRERIEALLHVVENTAGDFTKADDAERHVIEELRKMGSDALHCWAEKAAQEATEALREQQPKLHGDGKKKVCWHTTFGIIMVMEPMLRYLDQRFRPFSASAGVGSRRCSMPLQRVMTDFGADHAFGKVPKKLQEHYGIEMPVSTVVKVTEHHGQQMQMQREKLVLPITTLGCLQQIVETDGCMLPIVTARTDEGDKRKNKKLHWVETRLAMAHVQGSVTPKFDATFGGSVDDAGFALLNCAVAAGFGTQTQVHGVGDGAPWIACQTKAKFGEQASYLVDFFHVCEYLAAASKTCDPGNPRLWTETQKGLLKNNEFVAVIENLAPFLEAEAIESDKTPVRACHRYLSNRTDQLDYKGAIEKSLPIGSGEIESAHRYVIQQRLKLSGAWWKATNVQPMLALRVVRANGDWERYWDNLSAAVAA